jgi:diacylglycerol kinase (ATP)
MFKSFKYALTGIKDALKSEPNLRFHFLASVAAFVLAFYLKFTKTELAVLTITIFLVIILEFINTAVEKLSDIVHPEQSEKVRIIKDISAAVVLLGAIASLLIAVFLFLPKLV